MYQSLINKILKVELKISIFVQTVRQRTSGIRVFATPFISHRIAACDFMEPMIIKVPTGMLVLVFSSIIRENGYTKVVTRNACARVNGLYDSPEVMPVSRYGRCGRRILPTFLLFGTIGSLTSDVKSPRLQRVSSRLPLWRGHI